MRTAAIRLVLWPLTFGLMLVPGCKLESDSGGSRVDSDIRASTSTDDGLTWSAPVAVNLKSDLDILFARSIDAGVTWTAPSPLNTDADIDAEDDFYPQVSTDGLGKWVAVWEHVE